MNQPTIPADGVYISHLWEHPQLTLAIFGMQVNAPEAGQAFAEAGIDRQLDESLSQAEGLLSVRNFTENGWMQSFQYWRSHEDLSNYSKRMPHMAWWKWLMEHQGRGLSFYHEIYQCKTAEAVYFSAPEPMGPSAFCTNELVEGGEGRSEFRQERFRAAAEA